MAVAAAFVLAWAVPTLAYDVIAVQHGGTVEGTISLDGAVPEPRKGSTSSHFRIRSTVDVFPMDEAGDSFVISW